MTDARRVRVIDAHIHLYPAEVGADPVGWAAARREEHWALLATRRRKDGRPVQGFPSVDQLLRDLDAAGVERGVLLGWYWEHAETCREQNRFYASCVRAHPDRLAAFLTLHPQAGSAALDEVRRARERGFLGLGELSPHSQGFAVDDPIWRDVLEMAGELGLPVNLHVTDPRARTYPGRVETPLDDFLAMARAHPRTTFVLAHWGGGLAWDDAALALPNIHFDTAASPLLYEADVWRRAPAERVLFGSDHPLVLYPRRESSSGLADLLEEAREAGVASGVLGANASRLLGGWGG